MKVAQKSRGTARFRRYELVSVCGIWQWRRHSGLLSQRAFFGVSFLLCPNRASVNALRLGILRVQEPHWHRGLAGSRVVDPVAAYSTQYPLAAAMQNAHEFVELHAVDLDRGAGAEQDSL
jgi:hypothetical protein